MSVYSGFSTRKQENEYYYCISKIIYTLSKRCVKAIKNEPVDGQKFAACIGKLFGMTIKLEEAKYQPPKFSEALQELALVLESNNESLINFNSLTQSRTITQGQAKKRYEPKLLMPQATPTHEKRKPQSLEPSRKPTLRNSVKQVDTSLNIGVNKGVHVANPVSILPHNYNQQFIFNKLPPEDDVSEHVQQFAVGINSFVSKTSKTLQEREMEFLAQFNM